MASATLAAKVVKLREIDGVICADTLDIARNFRKRHDHVLRDVDGHVTAIQALKPTAPNMGASGWFRLELYYDSKQERRRRYDMTEEGFALVVGRYTGKDALEWQIAYHTEFQRMKGLLGRAGAPGAYSLFEPKVELEPRDNVVAFQGPPRPQGDLFESPPVSNEQTDELIDVAEAEDRSIWARNRDDVPPFDYWTDGEWHIRRRTDLTEIWVTSGNASIPYNEKKWMIPNPSGKSLVLFYFNAFPPIEVVLRVYDSLGHGPYVPVAKATLQHFLAA